VELCINSMCDLLHALQLADKIMAKVSKAPHAKETKVNFGRCKANRGIKVDTTLTEVVPEHVARAFLSDFPDKGSKNIFKAKLLDKSEISKLLPGGGHVPQGNVSSHSMAKVSALQCALCVMPSSHCAMSSSNVHLTSTASSSVTLSRPAGIQHRQGRQWY
jgi:hypothetical protein